MGAECSLGPKPKNEESSPSWTPLKSMVFKFLARRDWESRSLENLLENSQLKSLCPGRSLSPITSPEVMRVYEFLFMLQIEKLKAEGFKNERDTMIAVWRAAGDIELARTYLREKVLHLRKTVMFWREIRKLAYWVKSKDDKIGNVIALHRDVRQIDCVDALQIARMEPEPALKLLLWRSKLSIFEVTGVQEELIYIRKWIISKTRNRHKGAHRDHSRKGKKKKKNPVISKNTFDVLKKSNFHLDTALKIMGWKSRIVEGTIGPKQVLKWLKDYVKRHQTFKEANAGYPRDCGSIRWWCKVEKRFGTERILAAAVRERNGQEQTLISNLQQQGKQQQMNEGASVTMQSITDLDGNDDTKDELQPIFEGDPILVYDEETDENDDRRSHILEARCRRLIAVGKSSLSSSSRRDGGSGVFEFEAKIDARTRSIYFPRKLQRRRRKQQQQEQQRTTQNEDNDAKSAAAVSSGNVLNESMDRKRRTISSSNNSRDSDYFLNFGNNLTTYTIRLWEVEIFVTTNLPHEEQGYHLLDVFYDNSFRWSPNCLSTPDFMEKSVRLIQSNPELFRRFSIDIIPALPSSRQTSRQPTPRIKMEGKKKGSLFCSIVDVVANTMQLEGQVIFSLSLMRVAAFMGNQDGVKTEALRTLTMIKSLVESRLDVSQFRSIDDRKQRLRNAIRPEESGGGGVGGLERKRAYSFVYSEMMFWMVTALCATTTTTNSSENDNDDESILPLADAPKPALSYILSIAQKFDFDNNLLKEEIVPEKEGMEEWKDRGKSLESFGDIRTEEEEEEEEEEESSDSDDDNDVTYERFSAEKIPCPWQIVLQRLSGFSSQDSMKYELEDFTYHSYCDYTFKEHLEKAAAFEAFSNLSSYDDTVRSANPLLALCYINNTTEVALELCRELEKRRRWLFFQYIKDEKQALNFLRESPRLSESNFTMMARIYAKNGYFRSARKIIQEMKHWKMHVSPLIHQDAMAALVRIGETLIHVVVVVVAKVTCFAVFTFDKEFPLDFGASQQPAAAECQRCSDESGFLIEVDSNDCIHNVKTTDIGERKLDFLAQKQPQNMTILHLLLRAQELMNQHHRGAARKEHVKHPVSASSSSSFCPYLREESDEGFDFEGGGGEQIDDDEDDESALYRCFANEFRLRFLFLLEKILILQKKVGADEIRKASIAAIADNEFHQTPIEIAKSMVKAVKNGTPSERQRKQFLRVITKTFLSPKHEALGVGMGEHYKDGSATVSLTILYAHRDEVTDVLSAYLQLGAEGRSEKDDGAAWLCLRRTQYTRYHQSGVVGNDNNNSLRNETENGKTRRRRPRYTRLLIALRRKARSIVDLPLNINKNDYSPPLSNVLLLKERLSPDKSCKELAAFLKRTGFQKDLCESVISARFHCLDLMRITQMRDALKICGGDRTKAHKLLCIVYTLLTERRGSSSDMDNIENGPAYGERYRISSRNKEWYIRRHKEEEEDEEEKLNEGMGYDDSQSEGHSAEEEKEGDLEENKLTSFVYSSSSRFDRENYGLGEAIKEDEQEEEDCENFRVLRDLISRDIIKVRKQFPEWFLTFNFQSRKEIDDGAKTAQDRIDEAAIDEQLSMSQMQDSPLSSTGMNIAMSHIPSSVTEPYFHTTTVNDGIDLKHPFEYKANTKKPDDQFAINKIFLRFAKERTPDANIFLYEINVLDTVPVTKKLKEVEHQTLQSKGKKSTKQKKLWCCSSGDEEEVKSQNTPDPNPTTTGKKLRKMRVESSTHDDKKSKFIFENHIIEFGEGRWIKNVVMALHGRNGTDIGSAYDCQSGYTVTSLRFQTGGPDEDKFADGNRWFGKKPIEPAVSIDIGETLSSGKKPYTIAAVVGLSGQKSKHHGVTVLVWKIREFNNKLGNTSFNMAK
eukprot:jgi/Bigna1/66996/fgenesh1_pg.2_\